MIPQHSKLQTHVCCPACKRYQEWEGAVYNAVGPQRSSGDSMDTIDVRGIRLLKCDKEDCRWNVGYTPCDFNRVGIEFTSRAGAGTRVCNFGRRALVYGSDIDSECPHKHDVCRLLAEYDTTFERRFWGAIDAEVARRVLGGKSDPT